jgi:hypothetical protein
VAKLPNPPDPTLVAADAALVANQERRKRDYLGMSAIGDPCERKLWLSFRHAKSASFDAITLKRFEDGHRTEDVIIARLRAVDGIEIYDRNEDGKQICARDLGGHFRGHYDFIVRGLLQAPSAWHIGEVKCSAKIGELEKHKALFGDKNALAAWNETYYAQAQCYMGYENLDRHYLVCTAPGGREWTSVRTDFDPASFIGYKAKAERVIFNDTAPPRIGESTHWLCRMCDMHGICHDSELPERSCRICVHATPERSGGWTCALGKLLMPCADHRYNPSMLKRRQIDVQDGSIVYADGYVDRGPEGV